MIAFECRWPASDGDDWTTIEAFDARDAAERYAGSVCNDDSDTCGDFERGQNVEVRAPSSADADTYRVTCEFEPTFYARRVAGGG